MRKKQNYSRGIKRVSVRSVEVIILWLSDPIWCRILCPGGSKTLSFKLTKGNPLWHSFQSVNYRRTDVLKSRQWKITLFETISKRVLPKATFNGSLVASGTSTGYVSKWTIMSLIFSLARYINKNANSRGTVNLILKQQHEKPLKTSAPK